MSAPQSVSAEPLVKAPGETLNVGVDFTNYGLVSGETLTGTPTVAVSPSGPTPGSPTVNVATFVNRKGQTVAIGKGVVFTLAGGTVDVDYILTVTCGTSASQTLSAECPVEVR